MSETVKNIYDSQSLCGWNIFSLGLYVFFISFEAPELSVTHLDLGTS